ncbi:MAG TPA: DUF4148 domain-containing protein [Burkholderiaceae bacterium]
MNTKPLLAGLLAFVASGHIFAQRPDKAAPSPGKTRAQVLEELKQAQESGNDMPTGFLAYHVPPTKAEPQAPSKTASKN